MTKNKIYKEARQFLNELEKNNKLEYDISDRGGTLGITADQFINSAYASKTLRLDDDPEYFLQFLPHKIGAFVNYLGGGLRGSICGSTYSDELPDINSRLAHRLDIFIDACKERYEEIEDEGHLNDDEYPDGDTNWEAQGTKANRQNGICSAY